MKFIAAAALIGYTQGAAITCTVSKAESFTDTACATADTEANTKTFKEGIDAGVKDMKDDCTKAGDIYIKMFCDTSGWGYTAYSDDKCATATTDKDKKNVWGECIKGDKAGSYKLTDAAYMKAGAAALMAMIASQY